MQQHPAAGATAMGRPNNAVLTRIRLTGLLALYFVILSNSVGAIASSFQETATTLGTGNEVDGAVLGDASKFGGLRLNLKRRQPSSTPQPAGAFAHSGLKSNFEAALHRSQLRLKYLENRARTSAADGRTTFTTSEDGESYKSKNYAAVGEYVADFQLGTPAQNVRAIIDTGSDLVWVMTGGTFYNKSNSSTYQQLACTDSSCSVLPTSSCQSQLSTR